jgi:hypothetical protein
MPVHEILDYKEVPDRGDDGHQKNAHRGLLLFEKLVDESQTTPGVP